MQMVKCANCQFPMSRDANTCPKCNYPRPENLGNCRVCGTVLAYSQHRYRSASISNTVVNGNSVGGGSYIRHVPCPKCGEPKPLRMFFDSGFGKLVQYGLGIPALFIMFVVAMNPASMGISDKKAMHFAALLHISANQYHHIAAFLHTAKLNDTWRTVVFVLGLAFFAVLFVRVRYRRLMRSR